MRLTSRVLYLLSFHSFVFVTLPGCAEGPSLPGKIVASYSYGYEESRLLVYDRGQLRDLRVSAYSPRWSKDGKTFIVGRGKEKIAFALTNYPAGSVVKEFSVPHPGLVSTLFADGSKMIYRNTGDIKNGVAQNLYSYDFADRTERQLTFYDKPRADLDSVDISPDARWVVYSWTPGYVEHPDGRSETPLPDVYRLDLSTGQTEKLFEGSRLDLSPDGKHLVYIAGGVRGEKFGTSDLVIYDFHTKQFTRLTNSKGMIFKHSPRFSPDGKWVAYVEELPGPNNRALVAVKSDGSGKKITLIKPGQYILNSLDWGP